MSSKLKNSLALPVGISSWGDQNENFKVMQAVRAAGFNTLDISRENPVTLTGKVSGLQRIINKTHGCVFSGRLPLPEIMKLISMVVGQQMLDESLHFTADGKTYREPIVIYQPNGHTYYNLILEQFQRLIDEGTIRQKLFDPQNPIIRVVTSYDELRETLRHRVEADTSIHGNSNLPTEEEIEVIKEQIRTFKQRTDIKEPDFKISGFTSASSNQPESAIISATKWTEGNVMRGHGIVTGQGRFGLMGIIVAKCVAAGGYSEGTSCYPILLAEGGIPAGTAKMTLSPDIYIRQLEIIKPGDMMFKSVGGRGGAGVFQESTTCFNLIKENNYVMRGRKDNMSYKPSIIDNERTLWDPMIELMKEHGFLQNKHFHVVKGTEHGLEVIDEIKAGKIKTASVYSDRIQSPQQFRAA